MPRATTIPSLAATFAALVLSVASAGATPLVRAAPVVDAYAEAKIIAPIMKVHGCHFDLGPNMAPDPVNGTHYHNRQCAVVRVGPPRGNRGGNYREPPYDTRPYDRGYDREPPRRPRRAYRDAPPPQPLCREQCRYVGPIKRCRTICE